MVCFVMLCSHLTHREIDLQYSWLDSNVCGRSNTCKIKISARSTPAHQQQIKKWVRGSNGDISRGERPFIDILQDRRYWVIHLITIPSLFLAGVIFLDSPFVYKLFGLPSFNQYFSKDNTLRQISLINDRFSSLNEISDIQSWHFSKHFSHPHLNLATSTNRSKSESLQNKHRDFTLDFMKDANFMPFKVLAHFDQ